MVIKCGDHQMPQNVCMHAERWIWLSPAETLAALCYIELQQNLQQDIMNYLQLDPVTSAIMN